jgi:hypothetical protein
MSLSYKYTYIFIKKLEVTNELSRDTLSSGNSAESVSLSLSNLQATSDLQSEEQRTANCSCGRVCTYSCAGTRAAAADSKWTELAREGDK